MKLADVMDKVEVGMKLEYKKGVLCVYINGLLDQKIEIQ